MFYVLSFACAKERTKEKHTGNDPDSSSTYPKTPKDEKLASCLLVDAKGAVSRSCFH